MDKLYRVISKPKDNFGNNVHHIFTFISEERAKQVAQLIQEDFDERKVETYLVEVKEKVFI